MENVDIVEERNLERKGRVESVRAGLSRRGFLTSAAAVALGAAGAGLVGCSPSEGGSTTASKAGASVTVDYASSIPWNAEYDVVVIGYGGAGSVASITAADEGASVLMVEKAPAGDEGGNTRYCGQALMWFDDYDRGVEFMKALNEGYESMTDEIIEFVVQGSIDAREWVLSMGAESVEPLPKADPGAITIDTDTTEWWSDNGTENLEWPSRVIPSGDHAKMVYIDGQFSETTKAYWNLLRENVEKRTDAITVWFDSPALSLVQDPLGKTVLGVEVNRGGESVFVRARNGVVLACGSFEANPKKTENFVGLPDLHPFGSEYNTGDGLDMALAVGADIWHMSGFAGPRLVPKYADSERCYMLGQAKRMVKGGNCIYVGGDATRFVKESGWIKHGKVEYSGTWRSQIIPNVMWAIFDQTGRDSGGKVEEIDQSLVIVANSIEELAEKIELDAEALRVTVERWNGYVDAGYDEQFERHTETLARIETAPFYALRLYAGASHCFGGPKRNTSCEVLDTMGNPIPHLYSAGELGSFWIDLYAAGGCVVETVYTGRVAGSAAAAPKDEVTPTEVMSVESDLQDFGNDLIAEASAAAPSVSLGDNEYLGVGEGLHGPVYAKVAVEDGTVTAVEVVQQSETVGVTDGVWASLPDAIVAAGGIEGVDAVSGATLASEGLFGAVEDALEQASA